MSTRVKVSKWGNSLGVRLPKTFTSQRAIADGDVLEIDDVKIVGPHTRRRSRYKLKDLLKAYKRPPSHLDFARAGKELA